MILAERKSGAQAEENGQSRYRPGLAAFALASALMMLVVAFMLAGLGHGWCAPFMPSLIATPIIPVLALIERRLSFRFYGCFFLAIAFVTDWWILHATQTDEPTYFAKAWQNDREFVYFWLAIWGGWQLWLILALTRRR